jgi:hypothetical protein
MRSHTKSIRLVVLSIAGFAVGAVLVATNSTSAVVAARLEKSLTVMSDAEERACGRSASKGRIFPVGTSQVFTGTDSVRIDSTDFALGSRGWTHFNVNPTVAMSFDSAGWLWDAYEADYSAVVDRLLEQGLASPDPGEAASHAARLDTGWGEGSITARLNTISCAFARTADVRLKLLAVALVNALKGPRYYGPPNAAVHNHGLFANFAIFDAGLLLEVPEWSTFASTRSARELPLVFSTCGMMAEQSSGYQYVNFQMWRNGISLMQIEPGAKAPLLAARKALGALLTPDGHLEPIGDGWGSSTLSTRRFPYVGALWCPVHAGSPRGSGWAAAQIGFPKGLSQHVLRFGPIRATHGHEDNGATTWWVKLGGSEQQVLGDRGLFDKTDGFRLAFERSAASHSVLEVGGISNVGGSVATKAKASSGAIRYLVTWAKGVPRTRAVVFGATSARMLVVDRINPNDSRIHSYTQHWQLAPGWQPSGANTASLGAMKLTIHCLVNGVETPLSPQQILHNTDFRQDVLAWDMQCRASRAGSVTIRTTLQVSR